MIVIAAAVLIALLFALLAFGGRNDSTQGLSYVVDGQISAEKAAPAVQSAQNFLQLVGEGNMQQASGLVSAYNKIGGGFTEEVAFTYFGDTLDPATCRHSALESYPARVSEHGGTLYDTTLINLTCKQTDGWELDITMEMNRNIAGADTWRFAHATVKDHGLKEVY